MANMSICGKLSRNDLKLFVSSAFQPLATKHLTPAVHCYYFQNDKYCGTYLLSPPEIYRKK